MCSAGRRATGPLWIAAGLVALLVLSLGGAWAYARLAGCTDGERAALEEFPQYGAREIEPETERATGGCVVRFDTSAPEEEIFAYYSDGLRQNGWEVEREPASYSEPTGHSTGQDGDEKTSAVIHGAELFARRDAYSYRLHYLPQPQADEARVIAGVEGGA